MKTASSEVLLKSIVQFLGTRVDFYSSIAIIIKIQMFTLVKMNHDDYCKPDPCFI